eukprot:jgi/Bigna1/60285/fgenesh1_kg.10_\
MGSCCGRRCKLARGFTHVQVTCTLKWPGGHTVCRVLTPHLKPETPAVVVGSRFLCAFMLCCSLPVLKVVARQLSLASLASWGSLVGWAGGCA